MYLDNHWTDLVSQDAVHPMNKLIWTLLIVAMNSHYTLLFKSKLLLSMWVWIDPNFISEFLHEIPRFVTSCAGKIRFDHHVCFLNSMKLSVCCISNPNYSRSSWPKSHEVTTRPTPELQHLLNGSWYKASRAGYVLITRMKPDLSVYHDLPYCSIIHVCSYVYIYIYRCIYTYVYIYISYLFMCICTHIFIYVCMHMCVYIYIYICI